VNEGRRDMGREHASRVGVLLMWQAVYQTPGASGQGSETGLRWCSTKGQAPATTSETTATEDGHLAVIAVDGLVELF
jgi:hypothetical protein